MQLKVASHPLIEQALQRHTMFKVFVFIFCTAIPWPAKRWLLLKLYGYEIHETSRIGLAWVFPDKLVMEAHSSIGHLTVCKGMRLVHLEEHASLGRLNWVSGFPANHPKHFAQVKGRDPALLLGRHSAVTNRHLIDCTDTVSIGEFSILAGFRSQILTHSVNIESSRQSSSPIHVGAYCFVGTDCVLLGGSVLPDCSVLGAKSLLNCALKEQHTLYGGVPARAIKSISKDAAFFARKVGFVD